MSDPEYVSLHYDWDKAVCLSCGAVVASVEKHTVWHRRLDDVLQAVALVAVAGTEIPDDGRYMTPSQSGSDPHTARLVE